MKHPVSGIIELAGKHNGFYSLVVNDSRIFDFIKWDYCKKDRLDGFEINR